MKKTISALLVSLLLAAFPSPCQVGARAGEMGDAMMEAADVNGDGLVNGHDWVRMEQDQKKLVLLIIWAGAGASDSGEIAAVIPRMNRFYSNKRNRSTEIVSALRKVL